MINLVKCTRSETQLTSKNSDIDFSSYDFYLQAIFASSIPEIIELVGSRSKYSGEYKREHGKRYYYVKSTHQSCLSINSILRLYPLFRRRTQKIIYPLYFFHSRQFVFIFPPKADFVFFSSSTFQKN